VLEKNTEQQLELVKLAITGDRIAFNQLYSMFYHGIYVFFFTRLKSVMDAQDLCQETFIKAHKKLAQLDRPESFKGWLFTIAGNCLKDHRRKERIKSFFGFFSDNDEGALEKCVDEASKDPAKQAVSRQFWVRMKDFEKKLSPHEREVFLLRFSDELSIAEIASVLSSTASSVKTHLYRAVKKFKNSPELHEFVEGMGDIKK